MAEIKRLTTVQELESTFAESKEKPVFIFKHSSSCPISSHALSEYENFVREYDGEDATFTLIMLNSARELSNEVARRTGVKHESPQVLLLVNDNSVWDDSHFEITKDKLEQVVMMYEHKAFESTS